MEDGTATGWHLGTGGGKDPLCPEGCGGQCPPPHPFHGDNKLSLAGGDGAPLLWDTGQIRARTHTHKAIVATTSLKASWRDKGRTQMLRGMLESPAQKVGHCHLRGTGAVRISLVPRLREPGGTRLRLADRCCCGLPRPCWLLSHTEERPPAGRWWWQEQVAEVGPWHLAGVSRCCWGAFGSLKAGDSGQCKGTRSSVLRVSIFLPLAK